MRILGVNGIWNLSNSRHSFTDELLFCLSLNHEVIDVKYPMMTAGLAYFQWCVDRRAKKVLKYHKPGDDLIAHSFGGMCVHRAMELGAKFRNVFLFAPAAEADIVFPEHGAERIFVIHSSTDKALKLGAMLPGHRFGRLGLDGHSGNDPRVTNINADGLDHGDYVKRENIGRWVSFIEDKLRE